MCDGHQFLNFIELIYRFNRYSIIKKKVYFKYFLFNNFKLTSDIEMTLKPTKIKGWRMLPVHMQLIHDLTYSERLSFCDYNNLKNQLLRYRENESNSGISMRNRTAISHE